MPLARVGIDYRPAILTGAGIGRAVRELCRALAFPPENRAHGLELHLFGHSLARAARSERAPGGARLHRLPIPGRSLPLLARLGLDASRLAGRAALFHWTDYIHPPVTAARRVLTIHDLAFAVDESFHGEEQSAVLLGRCRDAAAAAARIVCPTESTAKDVEQHLGTDRARITVIPFGSEHALRLRDDAHECAPIDRPYILALGTIEPRKNHGSLLAAWRRLGADRPRLVVIGRRGWQCDEIVGELEKATDSEDVEWHRSMPDARTYQYLSHARVLAYPSKLEGFGFPPLEALALGTPVVAGDHPAMREVLGEGSARFCDANDVDDLTAALDAAISDDHDRDARIQVGQQRAERFSWSRCADEHANLYREVLA